jgi:hypothetical protein
MMNLATSYFMQGTLGPLVVAMGLDPLRLPYEIMLGLIRIKFDHFMSPPPFLSTSVDLPLPSNLYFIWERVETWASSSCLLSRGSSY